MNKYTTSLTKLNDLLTNLERDNFSIDEIADRVEEALSLIESLNTILDESELKVEEIISCRSTSSLPNNNPKVN